LPHEAGRIMKTLKDKDICAELIINPKDRKDVTVKAKIESIDFGYIKEISKNHMLTIPYPKEVDFI
jgi:HJR/Mrr/RecB family endonuclease